MERFWSLVEKGIITQRIIALALTGVVSYLWVSGKPVPDDLRTAFMVVLGFFFASEIGQLFIRHLLEEVSGRD